MGCLTKIILFLTVIIQFYAINKYKKLTANYKKITDGLIVELDKKITEIKVCNRRLLVKEIIKGTSTD